MMVIMFNSDDGDAEVVLIRTSCLNCFDCDVWTPQAGGRRCCWSCATRLKTIPRTTMHYVHFVKYDVTVSFYDAVSDTIRRRGGDRGIFTEEGVDTVAYFGGNHGFRV